MSSEEAGAGEQPRSADVVIVGAGVVGCFTALELAKQGLKPVVVEKDDIGSEQSSRNWGYIRQQGRDDPEIPLMVSAHDTWASFEKDHGVDIDWAERGNLRLVASEADLSWYRDWAVKGNAEGVPAKVLPASDIPKLLPGSQGTWVGAMFTPNDGQADPARATLAVAQVAERAGARFITGTAVTKILVESGKVTGVATDRGVIATDRVVVAGGIWSRRLLRPLGLDLPMQWVRLAVAETAPVEDFPDIPAVWSPKVAFRKTGNNTILFAASQRADVDIMVSSLNNVGLFLPTLRHNLRTFQVSLNKSAFLDLRSQLSQDHRYSGWEPKPNPTSIRQAFAALTTIYPELAEVPIARAWGGVIDGTPDNRPVISGTDSVEGLIIGAGFSGHGFGLSPATGAVLARLVRGEDPGFDISAFDFARFTRSDFRSARKVAH